MFKLGAFYKNPSTLSDVLPWAALVGPGVILNKDGSLQRTCRFRGPDLESASDEAMQAAMARLNNVLKRLGSGWALYVEARRESLQCEMPKIQGDFPLALLVDLEHHKRFSEQAHNFQSTYYLTLQYLPPTEIQQGLWRNFVKQVGALKNEETEALQTFIETSGRIIDILSDLCFETENLSDEATLTYLHHAVSTKKHPVHVPETPIYLDALLADTPLSGGIAPKLGAMHLRTLTIIGFPATSIPAILDRLNFLPIAYRWMTRFIAMDKLDAEQQLKRHRQRWFSKRKNIFNLLQEVLTKQESTLQDQAAVQNARELDEALQLVSSDVVSYGYFTCALTLQAESEKLADEMIKEVERVINGLGFTTINETLNAVEAWLSTLPGQAYANVRKPLLNTLNLAHLIPFSSVWSGQREDEHLASSPLFYAYTYGNTPFRFVLHVGDVGHHMIVGPTGAGKSVFLNFLALNFLRYPRAQVIIFDKGRSFWASTRGVGGVFYLLGAREGLHFQPLANIDHEAEIAWAAEWLQELLAHEKIEVTPAMKQHLWQALRSLAGMPRSQRTLSGLTALLQEVALREAMSTFTLSGPFGSLLDADEEKLSMSRWVCFEMEALMQMPSVVAPVLSYLFHRLEQQFQGDPTLLILDEAWLFLDHPIFTHKIRDWLKSLRKKNVSVIFATQSVADASDHFIAPTLLEACVGRVFLPNDRALEPQIKESYQRLGLNEKQLMLLTQATPKKNYYYQSRLGNRLFSLELGALALAFCAASKPSDIHWLAAHEHASHEAFLQAFLSYKKLDWAAEILRSYS